MHIYNGNIDPRRARAAIREIYREIAVQADESGMLLIARFGLNTALLKAAGGTEKFVVARERFVEHLNVELR